MGTYITLAWSYNTSWDYTGIGKINIKYIIK